VPTTGRRSKILKAAIQNSGAEIGIDENQISNKGRDEENFPKRLFC
jgi:hypothetical protein